MEKVVLLAQIRKELGKSKAKALRSEGMVPCVCYKGGKEALSLKVDYKDLWGVLHTKAGENVLITLKIKEDEKSHKDKIVLVKEVQHEPIKDRIIHVDFNEVSLTEKIQVNVSLAARGQPEGVVKDGGVLDRVLWELQVECLPTEIPDKIEVEISQMKIGDTVFVKEITPPKGVKILNDPELIAITVHPPYVEKVEGVAPEEAAQEPEVIKKGKKEEELIEEEEAPPAGEKKPKEEEKKSG